MNLRDFQILTARVTLVAPQGSGLALTGARRGVAAPLPAPIDPVLQPAD